VGFWQRLVERHRNKQAEREAIVQAIEESRRAGEDDEPHEDVGSSVYPYMSGDA